MTWGYGKVILLGEHAVVHGHPAIAGALDRGVRVEVSEGGPGVGLTVEAWSLQVHSATDIDHPVCEAIDRICRAHPALVEPAYQLTAEATLPAGAGLGSSAALCVAITRALLADRGAELGDDEVAAIANAGEHAFHETPSGVDAAVAARGGLCWFRRGAPPEPIDAEPVPLVIGLSGEPRSTAEMVARVSARTEPSSVAALAELGDLTRRGRPALENGDLLALGRLFDRAQTLLASLGVSTDRIDQMCAAAKAAGATGVKLTGAGGGGAVIALAPGRRDHVLAAWRELGVESFHCRAGVKP